MSANPWEPMNVERHEGPTTLVHRIASGFAVPAYSPDGTKLAALVVWKDNTMSLKVREALLSYDGTGRLSSITEKQYDSAGTLIITRPRAVTLDPLTGAITSIDG